MAKKKPPVLNIAPFPELTWDDYFWRGQLVLTAWAGFQSRLGPYGARSSKKPADGTTRLVVDTIEQSPKSVPLPEQITAFDDLCTKQLTIRDTILTAVFAAYPTYREEFIEDYDLDEDDTTLPILDKPEQLSKVLGLTEVLIHKVSLDGVAYVGYQFGCEWEREHGLGVMMHKDRVVSLGGADTAILEWIAERDIKAAKAKKRKPRGK